MGRQRAALAQVSLAPYVGLNGNGWLRVTDDDTTSDLDRLAERLASAHVPAEQDTAERATAGEGRTEDGDQTARASPSTSR
jgi:hypothetical protein